jgi:bifunctional non-homologous end joining protein LigD
LKTTGGKGLHLVVPIKATTPWDEAKQFCKAIADDMARAEPERYLANISKAKRKNKILIDYLRNARGATAVCVYSTRARAGAKVAAPIAWEELSSELRPDQFDVRNLPQRLAAIDEGSVASLWRDSPRSHSGHVALRWHQ